ncbi:Uncharacterised protein [Bordetella pertussis]|nr:Uncharacterised protein [Bordetella pertussis]
MACELLFFAWAAAALGRAIYRRGASRRNDGVPLLVLGLGAADALYLLAARAGDYPLLLQRFNGNWPPAWSPWRRRWRRPAR